MIITRSPLRITLGGGGTDLPSYYQDHSGFVLAAAIDKYVYITLHHRFVSKILLKYSQLEEVNSVDEIKHPLIRESLRLLSPQSSHLEMTSMADIPAGTGLGSSGSFCTALLRAIHALNKNPVHPDELADQACRVEMDILREPVGKQDPYIAAYGGLTCFRFMPNGEVETRPLRVTSETLYNLEDNLLLFYTGTVRSASSILRDQDEKSKKRDSGMIGNLHLMKQIGRDTKEALEKGNLVQFAELMNMHWEHKQARSAGISNGRINEWYQSARKNGALGGKLIGAGGGGFFLFYSEDRIRLRRAMGEAGLQEVRFRFDFEGSNVVVQA
jgi:D-glycero-alpha-D-manno-heptose-7-phosphate kinase